jgi:DNA-binding XRE family transcriptional regulator
MKLVAVSDDGSQVELPQQKDVPAYIQSSRLNMDMSLQQVAASIGVTRQAVWGWENGKSCPTVTNLTKLVSLFEGIDRS